MYKQRQLLKLNIACFMIILLAGCASYSMRPVMTHPPEDYRSMAADSILSMAADPLDDKISSEAIFNTDLNRFGFLAVNVIIRNDGKRPFRIHSQSIKLLDIDGYQLPYAPVEAIVSEAGASILKWSIISGDMGEISALEAREKMVQDMIAKEFYDQSVLPGTTVSGFLYFQHKVSRSGTWGYRLVLADSPSGQPLEVMIR